MQLGACRTARLRSALRPVFLACPHLLPSPPRRLASARAASSRKAAGARVTRHAAPRPPVPHRHAGVGGVLPTARGVLATAVEAAASGTAAAAPSHLVVFVNGLTGAPSNWDFMLTQFRERLPADIAADMLLHRSEANQRLDTWLGVDVCGKRLAAEVRALADANPGLSRVTFLAHSMGGLIARFACGELFDPADRTIAGLQPAHFISLASPFCGCDTDGVSAVPFIRWASDAPLLGRTLARLFEGVAHATAAALLSRTGEQFFLVDGAGGEDPLLLQMTRDVPARGLHFLSALAAFKTRTAYANTDGDHLVGWANSSLRPLSALPPLPPEATRDARGVVREDPLSAAWAPEEWARLQQRGAVADPYQPSSFTSSAPAAATPPQPTATSARADWNVLRSASENRGISSDSSADAGSSSDGSPGGDDAACASAADDAVAAAAVAAELRSEAAAAATKVSVPGDATAHRKAQDGIGAAAQADLRGGLRVPWLDVRPLPPESRSRRVARMLDVLCTLPWRRIDVCFAPTLFPFSLAHNNIQVTRELLNFQGRRVPRHVAETLAAMEKLASQARADVS